MSGAVMFASGMFAGVVVCLIVLLIAYYIDGGDPS
jgi:formate/nitrite transporter FocA (FNT family)